jgi:hypothetical protein
VTVTVTVLVTPPPPPSPPPPATCQLSAKCIEGLKSHKECMPTTQNGGRRCYQGLKVWQKVLTEKYGCPEFEDKDTPVFAGKAFCWCGLASSASDYSVGLNNTLQAIEGSDSGALEVSAAMSKEQNQSAHLESGSESCKWISITGNPQEEGLQCAGLRHNPAAKTADACRNACCQDSRCKVWQYHGGDSCYMGIASYCAAGSTGWQGGRKATTPPPQALACRNSHDEHILRSKGKWGNSNDMKACALSTDGSISQTAQCMQKREGLSAGCSWCYGQSIQCSEQYCIEECACSAWNEPHCHSCMTRNCEAQFRHCGGLLTEGSLMGVFDNSTSIDAGSEENSPLLIV